MTEDKIAAKTSSGLRERPLTTTDIQSTDAALTGDMRLAFARDLAEAAETPGGLAEPAAAPYALSLAAEIYEDAGNLAAALECAEKAVAADERTNRRFPYARAACARLLFAVGREQEALSHMRELRPVLTSDPDAVHYVSETLQAAGHAETAVQWLTGAAIKLLERPHVSSRRQAQAYLIAITRRRLRADLDQPMDEYDAFAVRTKASLDAVIEESLKPSRNAPCHCGSGLKYKRCHGRAE